MIKNGEPMDLPLVPFYYQLYCGECGKKWEESIWKQEMPCLYCENVLDGSDPCHWEEKGE